MFFTVFGDFRSKVLGSFKRIKKDMTLLEKANKSLSRDVRLVSKKVVHIDMLRKRSGEMQKQLDIQSKALKKIASSKGLVVRNGIFSRNHGREFSKKLSMVHSELKTEIEGMKYEMSKSSENSYQAYSDSIIVQREIDYLKKENRLLREELSKRQDVLENNMSKGFSDLGQSIDAISSALEDIKGKSRSAVSVKSGKGYDSILVDSMSSELDAIKMRLSHIERSERPNGERGPVIAPSVKSQKTIFSFNSVKPIVKMFSRKPRKSKNRMAIDVNPGTKFENSPGSASAKMEYMPQPWSRISGYKRVEKKEKSSGYFW